MYLKTLTLRGFKSFASATTLRFEPGITCVVGPNGSGKSNVVDALSWVMGEQGVKPLRGGKMEDVVFAGTSSRPPLGRAEVTLTIDNTDGALPIDYTEVTISRLLFRSGQSEYFINGNQCRLLDVAELLSDSGLGREMHVIVGQGHLDDVLQAGPEARRALIEEAAGVLKHRRRKEKALRKLEAMQANLTRLVDLTGELRRRLGPLGRQERSPGAPPPSRRICGTPGCACSPTTMSPPPPTWNAGRRMRPPRWPGAESLSRRWRRRASESPHSTPPSRRTRPGWRRRRRYGSPSPRSPSACAESAGSRRSATPTWGRAGAAAPRPRPGRARTRSGRAARTGGAARGTARGRPGAAHRGDRRPGGSRGVPRRGRAATGRAGARGRGPGGAAGQTARAGRSGPQPGGRRQGGRRPPGGRAGAGRSRARLASQEYEEFQEASPAATTTAAAWPQRTNRRPRRWARSPPGSPDPGPPSGGPAPSGPASSRARRRWRRASMPSSTAPRRRRPCSRTRCSRATSWARSPAC